jgi:hypothetical protein
MGDRLEEGRENPSLYRRPTSNSRVLAVDSSRSYLW